MQTILEQMIEACAPKNNEERKNVIKEVMQEIVLCGLSKAGFFNEAAFYGGTALRIFYNLDRFYEDLDFSLLTKNKNFDLSKYFPILENTIKSFGMNVSIDVKSKTSNTNIQSAFLKGDTIEHFLLFYPDIETKSINKNERIKIKFEIDISPPGFATYETKFRLLPIPYDIKLFDEASLFSGKIHAVILRSWKSRVKGRDLYDLVFYITRGTKFNLSHLKEKFIESKFIEKESDLNCDDVKQMLINRFAEIDFDLAKEDVTPFIKDKTKLDLWSKDFFSYIVSSLESN